ncbi:phosphotransferase [Streptomyces sp. NPDC003027]
MLAPDLDLLRSLAREAVHAETARCACPHAVLADREDGTVVRHGPVVLKAHAPGTGGEDHRARIAVAADARLRGVLLPPLTRPDRTIEGRPLTAWPYGTPVDPGDPDAAPWEDAARLLARLHRTAPPAGLPPMRAPVKAALAVERMCRADAAPRSAVETVLRAWSTVPQAPAAPPGLLCHGDFHLGQLVREPGTPDGRWLLIDVDDLGVGDPAWDLARPAAWFAAGILPPEVWARFLGAYQAEGGPAAPFDDPWAALDLPARALTVQAAALALAKAATENRPLDEVEEVMIDTCARIGAARTELAPPASA